MVSAATSPNCIASSSEEEEEEQEEATDALLPKPKIAATKVGAAAAGKIYKPSPLATFNFPGPNASLSTDAGPANRQNNMKNVCRFFQCFAFRFLLAHFHFR